MKTSLIALVLAALALWMAFAAILLGYQPLWLPPAFAALARPASMADLGQAFSTLEGLISSLALMLGLVAVLLQVKHGTDANLIGALTARQQFLLADYDRLDRQIADHVAKHSGKPSYDQNLVTNMVNKRKERLEQARLVDQKLKLLLPSQ